MKDRTEFLKADETTHHLIVKNITSVPVSQVGDVENTIQPPPRGFPQCGDFEYISEGD